MSLKHPFVRRLGWIAFWLLLIHVIIEISGHHYLYPTVRRTILKGKLGPDIQEYKSMPNNTITAGNPQFWNENASLDSLKLNEEDEAYHVDNQTVAYLVVHNDEIIFEKYWEHFGDTSLSNSFSMAKSIVSLLIGIAIDRGEIESVETPVYWYLPQYETELGKRMTIEDLLTMSSGIDFNENYLNPFAFPARANYGDNLELLLRNYEVTETPGEVFNYQSGATQVLGFVLKSATRKTLSEYASEHVWQKIGAEHDALWSLDHEGGAEKAFCCINATARDFTRIGKLYHNHGKWNGKRIVDSAYVHESVSLTGLKNEDGTECTTYGYSWWLGQYNEIPFYFMRGIKGQYVIVIPEDNLIVTRLGRKRHTGSGKPHPVDVYRYIDMAYRQIEG